MNNKGKSGDKEGLKQAGLKQTESEAQQVRNERIARASAQKKAFHDAQRMDKAQACCGSAHGYFVRPTNGVGTWQSCTCRRCLSASA
jgi:hypothetical protein